MKIKNVFNNAQSQKFDHASFKKVVCLFYSSFMQLQAYTYNCPKQMTFKQLGLRKSHFDYYLCKMYVYSIK